MAHPAPDPSPIMPDFHALNALEAFLIADKNESLLYDLIENCSATNYGATSETWTPDSLQRLFEEELVHLEKSKSYDENASAFLDAYNSVKGDLTIDWVKVCYYL